MNEHEKKPVKLVFCPLEQDVIETVPGCILCGFWDGKSCCFYGSSRAKFRPKRLIRAFSRTLTRAYRRLSRRRGRRLRVPLIWEKWSFTNQEEDEYSTIERESDYGIENLPVDEELNAELNKKKDEQILPEMIKEYWDVKPDIPDWIPEVESAASSPNTTPVFDPALFPEFLPQEPKPEHLPPAMGPDLDTENPLGGIPGFPPDGFGPGLP